MVVVAAALAPERILGSTRIITTDVVVLVRENKMIIGSTRGKKAGEPARVWQRNYQQEGASITRHNGDDV